MSREVRVAQLSLEILNLIRTSENASFLAPDELKESIIRVRSMVDFLCAPLVIENKNAGQAPQAPQPPAEKKGRAAKKESTTPPAEAPAEAPQAESAKPEVPPETPPIEFYNGTVRDHKKILVGILKEDHDFDLNDKTQAEIAGEVNGELTKQCVDVKNIPAIKTVVGELVEAAYKRREGAPF